MQRYYYAGHSYMGVDFTYDSPCWVLHVFQTKEQRDNWVWNNRYNDQNNIVAEVTSEKDAVKIASRKALDDIRSAALPWRELESQYRVIMHGINEE